MHQLLGIWWKCCLEWGVSLVCPKLAELLINGVASAPTLQAAWPPHLLALLGYASTHYWWYCPAFFSCCVLRRVKLGWNTLNCSLFNGQCWYMCQDAQCLKPLKQPLLSSCKFPLLWLTLQPLSFAFLTCSHTFLAGFQHFNFFLFFFLQLKVTGSILGGSLSGWRTCSAKRNKTDDFSLRWQCYLQVLSSPYKRVLACL